HCYRRPVYPQWPYSLFTMVHATSTADCERVLGAIAEATGLQHYATLYSTHEYKKTRVEYFTGAERAWMHSVGLA
ncbi:MAG: Lrp/AsnC family transcriptional regulator, partial [Actinobacteria bacterium]|nr:Lrp/AsnC family transcriptional regulator [Actinomycetota bacterium]